MRRDEAPGFGIKREVSIDKVKSLTKLDRLSNRKNKFIIVDIVGVIAGLKPVALMEPNGKIEALLPELGLCSRVINEYRLAVSKDADKLAAMDHWSNKRNEDDDTREIGRLLGYPETAVEYFVARSPTVRLDLEHQLPFIQPRELLNTIHDEFAQLVLSPDNWRKELADYVYPLEVAVRNLTPKNFRRIEKSVKIDGVRRKIARLIGMKEKSSFNPKSVSVKVVG